MNRANSPLPFHKTFLGQLTTRVKRRWLRTHRWAYQLTRGRRTTSSRILLIVGCQRSGTKLMLRVFERDLRTTVLQENSCITGENDRGCRLLPYREVNEILARFGTPLIVAKPLEESHDSREMLESIPGSKAIWMFRHYRDVARSKVNKSFDQMRHIKHALSNDEHSSLSGRLSASTRSILSALSCREISQHDAAALYWYARNILFFQLQLDKHPDVLLCKYEDFATRPQEVMRRIYGFACVGHPNKDTTREVDSAFAGLGHQIQLDRRVDALCGDLLKRLDECYERLGNRPPALANEQPAATRESQRQENKKGHLA